MKVLPFIRSVAAPYWFYLTLASLNAIIFSSITVAVPFMVRCIVNAASEPCIDRMWQYGLIIIALECIVAASWRVADWAQLKYEPALRNTINQVVFKQLSLQPHRYFQNNFAGALSAKMSDIVIAIPAMIAFLINGLFFNVLTIAVTITTVASIHWLLAGALSLWALLFIAISSLTLKRLSFLTHRSAEAGSGVMARCVDAVTNMLSVRLFARYEEEKNIIAKAQATYLHATQKRRWYSLGINMAQSAGFTIYQAGCILLLIMLRAKNMVTPGDFALIIGVNLSLIDNLWHLSDKMKDFADQWGQTTQALDTFYEPLEVQDAPDAVPLQATNGEIVFHKVRFHYPGGEGLFQDKTLTIPGGQRVGLVGYSGGGKSTFVNLILRLYDLTGGEISIDNQNIAKVTQASLRNAIAFVPQEPSLFHRSVADNISYGNPKATEALIKAAAKKAAAHEFIMKLPEKYDTTVGERGTKLSGGQRQRIALARAILKEAPILILDEATSQLDTITEKEIQSSFTEWFEEHGDTNKQTTLVIAHRLSTLLHMDRILVFDKGHIVQDGTHAALLAQEGLYQSLWKVQTKEEPA